MSTPSAGVLCSSILKALTSRAKFIRSVVIILLVWAAQAAVTELFFRCPCYDVTPGSDIPHRRESYSVMWMFVPALSLWLISILLLDTTWRCVVGCRNRPRPHPDQGCICCWQTLGESSLPPLTWLFLVFIDGTFMECARAYIPSNCLNPANPPPNLNDILDRNIDSRWKSTMTGLGLALSLVIIYFLASLCYRCSSSMSYYQSRYADHIHQLEQEALDDAAREENYPVLKARWKALFHTGVDKDWTDASTIPYTAPVKKKAGFIYTQFHGMRFSGEQNYMDDVLLPSYHRMRPEIVVIPEQPSAASYAANSTPTKSIPAISHKDTTPTQPETRNAQREQKRRKKKVSTVQVISPPESGESDLE